MASAASPILLILLLCGIGALGVFLAGILAPMYERLERLHRKRRVRIKGASS